MDIRDYWRVMRKRWISILLITLVCGYLGVAISAASTKMYAGTATNFVAIGGASNDPSGSMVYSGASFTLQRVKSYVNVVNTPTVLEPTIEQLGLDMTVQQVARMVSASNPPQTVLLNITVRGPDPQLVSKLANVVAVNYANEIERLETPAGSSGSPIKVSMIIGADVPTTPVSPRTKVNVALGLLLGFGLGVGQALLRDQLDNSIRSARALSDVAGGAPALGNIGFDPDAQTTPLVALNVQAHRSEAFRTIRTNLQYIDVDNPPRIVAITSALPDEGKTTTACNLAITLAQAGRSVCIIDADLRRPKLSEYLGIAESVGLTDVLSGNETLAETLLPWHRGLLTVLPVGSIPPNPSELLASHQMSNVLEDLRHRFDTVILDAAPLLPVADGAIVASITDGALLIARCGRTTRDQTERACEALRRVDARLLGVVLNFVPEGQNGYGDYNYYADQDAEPSDETPERWSRRTAKAAKERVGLRA